MNGPAPRSRGLASLVLLGAVGGLFGYLSGLPDALGTIVVVAAVGLGAGLQRIRTRSIAHEAFPAPVVAALVSVAMLSPYGLLAGLLGGASGVALLVWLADDPGRPAGGIGRSTLAIGVPGLAIGIAWASAFLLPPGAASLGVAVALLVFVVVAVAYLIGEPATYDREESPLPS